MRFAQAPLGAAPPLRPLWGIVAVALLCSAATAADVQPLRSSRPPYFTVDMAIALDNDAKPALSVTFTISYTELQWVRLERGMGSGLEFTVALIQRDGFPGGGDVWERRIVVPDFGATRKPGAALIESKVFAIKPGRYEARIAVADLNSGLSSSVQQHMDVPDYSKVPVGFVDLALGVWGEDSTFHPVTTRRYGTESSRLAARAMLFDRRPGTWPRDYPLHYVVRQAVGDPVAQGDTLVRLEASGRPVVLRPHAGELFIGDYTLEVQLVQGKSRWRVERSFAVEASGPPQGREFDRTLEVLAYIARPEEIDYLRSLPPEKQAQGWDDFWRRRDPTPDTPENEALVEFFRRVRYAEQHFQGIGPGWRSDMGRVYIKYGPPDQIENRAATLDSPAMEVWYYYNPSRRFYFADREGFGRYVLIGPQGEP